MEAPGESFAGFVNTPPALRNINVDRRVEALECKWSKLMEKLDKVLSENEAFRKEIHLLMKENHELLKEKIEAEKDNIALRKQCGELQDKMAELEKRICESELGGEKECLTAIENKVRKVEEENENVRASFREIMMQQEKEKTEIAHSEVVKMLQQNEDMVRNIAEKKKCIIVTGLKEEENRNWQERKRKEDDLIKSLLANFSEEGEDLFGEVEESVRLGAFEKGKNRPLKIKLKSQITAEFLLQNSWKLKDQDETKGIYVRRNMTEQKRKNLKDILK